MQMQWVILLIGIGTVFAGLFIIQLIIALFKVTIAPKEARPALEPQVQSTRPASEAGTDSRLVAVIAAAIAAASGSPLSSFRIASIEPASSQAGGFNTPAWGYIDRVARTVRGRS